jgi:hypothetical protein
MGAGAIGFEFDFGYAPNFFESIVDDDDFTFADGSNVTTLMGNIIIGAPIGGQSGPGIRPFGVAGLGLIRTQVTGADNFFDVDANDWGGDHRVHQRQRRHPGRRPLLPFVRGERRRGLRFRAWGVRFLACDGRHHIPAWRVAEIT